MELQSFVFISGRGWVTLEPRKCPSCGHLTNGMAERPATAAEIAGIIRPALEKEPTLSKVMVDIAEVRDVYPERLKPRQKEVVNG
jgi:hypothetical protein